MKIKTAKFLKSSSELKQCPLPNTAEYAFIGRSNVGKSSLINMVTNHMNLAKTSGKPGKTQLINHFIINDEWYLVDLPGYGYAKVSKSIRGQFTTMIEGYLQKRRNLLNTFVLIDCRLEPQKNDMEFLEFMGLNELPFTIVFTKADKLKPHELETNVENFRKALLEQWEEVPPMIISSSETKRGRDEILAFIEQTNRIIPSAIKKY
jgi:GTP-binding protein